jgi:DNA-binding NarL/FixJ family response regulator
MREVSASDDTWLDVADAAYDLAAGDEVWLGNVLAAARPLIDHGSFVHAWLFRMTSRAPVATSVLAYPGGITRERAREIIDGHLPPDPRAMNMPLHRIPLAMTASEFFAGNDPPATSGIPPGFDLRDSIGLTAVDPSGVACVLVGSSTARLSIGARERTAWRKVASHIASAMRLRDRLRELPGEASLDAADALFDEHKRIVHEGPDARAKRELVREAAEIFARRRSLPDSTRALELWRALIAGRWSFVETIDTDGKRFYVLRKNDPRTPGPPLLDARERTIAGLLAHGDSNKAIAYHLGVAESTVSRGITRICKKLGVASRVQLTELMSAIAMQALG